MKNVMKTEQVKWRRNQHLGVVCLESTALERAQMKSNA